MVTKPKSKYADAKFLLKNAKKHLENERLNDSAKHAIRFSLFLAEKMVNGQGEMTTRDLCEMSRECRGWLKDAREFDKAEEGVMIAKLLAGLDALENAVNDDDLEALGPIIEVKALVAKGKL